MGSTIKQLYEQVLNASDKKEVFRLLDNYLLKELYNPSLNDKLVSDVANAILRTKGTLTVRKLLSIYGISERRLEQRFNEILGVSPKFFSRLARFHNSLKLLRSGKNLTEITYKCGYFDQAHFIKNFRDFSSTTPSKYLHEKHYIDNVNTQAASF